MQKDNIITYINKNAKYIKEEDLHNLLQEVVDYFSFKISQLAIKSYSIKLDKNNFEQATNNLAFDAFKEGAKEVLLDGLNTFLFKKQHWKNKRDIEPYLLTCLNYYSLNVKIEFDGTIVKRKPICPGCKFYGFTEDLTIGYDGLRCEFCVKKVNSITYLLNNTENIDDKARLEALLVFRKCFSEHSRKGYKCPDCERFIPDSCKTEFGISCPYLDCVFFGKVENLNEMSHPTRSWYNHTSGINKEQENTLRSKNIDAETAVIIFEQFNNELKILSEVIDLQMSRIKPKDKKMTSIQKRLMYQAYKNMLNKYPEEMVSYLVHMKHVTEFAIQAKIFQEYVKLLRDMMPLTVTKGGEEFDIISLTDPNLCLFTGISKFEAEINKNHIIPNNTIETYTGGRKFKNMGSCFIGLLIDVKDINTGKSLLDDVVEYNFAQIKMKNDIPINTKVEVTHFRMIPHYEMGNLVHLQRIRRKIVDSVYFRIHGKKREIVRVK